MKKDSVLMGSYMQTIEYEKVDLVIFDNNVATLFITGNTMNVKISVQTLLDNCDIVIDKDEEEPENIELFKVIINSILNMGYINKYDVLLLDIQYNTSNVSQIRFLKSCKTYAINNGAQMLYSDIGHSNILFIINHENAVISNYNNSVMNLIYDDTITLDDETYMIKMGIKNGYMFNMDIVSKDHKDTIYNIRFDSIRRTRHLYMILNDSYYSVEKRNKELDKITNMDENSFAKLFNYLFKLTLDITRILGYTEVTLLSNCGFIYNELISQNNKSLIYSSDTGIDIFKFDI